MARMKRKGSAAIRRYFLDLPEAGDDEIATIIADANLVDAQIGALIIAYPDLPVVLAVGQGLAEIAVQGMIDNASGRALLKKLSVATAKPIAAGCWTKPGGVNSRFALAIRACPMLETARTGGDARFPAGV